MLSTGKVAQGEAGSYRVFTLVGSRAPFLRDEAAPEVAIMIGSPFEWNELHELPKLGADFLQVSESGMKEETCIRNAIKEVLLCGDLGNIGELRQLACLPDQIASGCLTEVLLFLRKLQLVDDFVKRRGDVVIVVRTESGQLRLLAHDPRKEIGVSVGAPVLHIGQTMELMLPEKCVEVRIDIVE